MESSNPNQMALENEQVPVGRATLGRIINVIGEPIDEKGDIKTEHFHYSSIEKLQLFVEQATEQQILVTGIKVVDLLAPYQKEERLGSLVVLVWERQCLLWNSLTTLIKLMVVSLCLLVWENVLVRVMTCTGK